MPGSMSPVRFEAPPDVVFDYLADPRNRPAWQSSLRSVELLDPVDGSPPRVGMRWVDRTAAGVRPTMQITELSRPHRWAESGVWRGISASLVLTFAPAGAGTSVAAEASFSGPAWQAPVRFVLARLAPYALRSDLRRAARLLR